MNAIDPTASQKLADAAPIHDGDGEPRVWRYVPARVYAIGAALFAWVCVMAWLSFSGASYFGVIVAVLVLFTLIFLGVPSVLAAIQRSGKRIPAAEDESESFSEWRHGRFETRSGQMEARTALLQILLLPGAAALAMTCFSIVEIIQRANF